jgi:hypothetical protein
MTRKLTTTEKAWYFDAIDGLGYAEGADQGG